MSASPTKSDEPSPGQTAAPGSNRCVNYVLLLLCTTIGCYVPTAFGPTGGAPREAVPPLQAISPSIPRTESRLPGELTIPPVLSWQPAAARHDWKYIVLHHTASDSGSVESIDRTHRERTDADGNAWRGIGYHFVIGNGRGMSDGEVRPTFRWMDQSAGAHAGNLEYNTHGIGICLVGNFEQSPPTRAQIEAARRLVAELKAAFHIDSNAVLRHGDVNATDCPGRLFPHDEIALTTIGGAGRAGPR